MSVRFGASFLTLKPQELAGLCRAAEDAGFDRVGLVDSPSLYRELWVSCAVAASHTARVRIGPRVTNPLTRHVVVTASATATLAELAPGRVFLGLGTGYSGVGAIGSGAATLEEMREAVHALRALLAGESASYHGKRCELRWAGARVPIYLSAHGPRMLRLAGQLADGVVIGTGLTREAVACSLELIGRGAEESGRSLADLDLWWLASANVSDSRETAVAEILKILAAMGMSLPGRTQNPELVPPRYAAALAALSRQYRMSEHLTPDGARRNAQLVRRLGLEGFLAERFALAGNADDCLRQIERALEAGARQLWLSLYFPDTLRFLDAWGSKVMSRLA
jgi:5,10-methylenetetrahydromethanopterin reductase